MILNSPTISGSLTVTGNIITSGSITLSGSVASASYASTSSFVALAQSASNAVSAATASFANAFTVASTLTAQTLVVQTITSSVLYSSGSNVFGNNIANTQVMTGSVNITGSINLTGSIITNNPLAVKLNYAGSVNDIQLGAGTPLRIVNQNYNSVLFYLDNTGSIGINTSTVLNKLDINQSGSSANPVFGVGLKVYADAGNDASIAMSQTARGTAVIGMAATGSAPADMVIGNDVVGNIIFKQSMTISNLNSGTERFKINATGTATFTAATQDAIQTVVRMSGKNASSQVKALDFKLTAGTPLWTISTAAEGTDLGINIMPNGSAGLSLAYTTGAATFSSSVTIGGTFVQNPASGAGGLYIDRGTSSTSPYISWFNGSGTRLGYMGYSNSNIGLYLENSAAFAITGGNVGIGTTDPSTGYAGTIANVKLALRGGTVGASGGTAVLLIGGDNNHYSSIIGYHGGGGATTLAFGTSASVSNPTARMTIDGSGNIGAPTGTNIYNASDRRLKQNIETITNGLDKITALNPVKFNWINNFVESENNKDMLGFIAQEVQNAVPEAIENFGNNSITVGEVVIDNPLRVNEKMIIPVLVKAIQELKTQNDALQSRIETLESK
jgi:hypothetical protein